MTDSKSNLKRAQRISYMIISLCLIVWAIEPEWKALAGGFIVGIAGSLIMSWHLQWKTAKFAALIAKSQSKPRFNLGFLTRASIGVLTYVVSVEVFHFNFYMTVVGLFAVQVITIALIGKFQSSVERGEK